MIGSSEGGSHSKLSWGKTFLSSGNEGATPWASFATCSYSNWSDSSASGLLVFSFEVLPTKWRKCPFFHIKSEKPSFKLIILVISLSSGFSAKMGLTPYRPSSASRAMRSNLEACLVRYSLCVTASGLAIPISLCLSRQFLSLILISAFCLGNSRLARSMSRVWSSDRRAPTPVRPIRLISPHCGIMKSSLSFRLQSSTERLSSSAPLHRTM